jgi:hypothetical protein
MALEQAPFPPLIVVHPIIQCYDRVMPSRILSMALAVVFFLLSFNAYACLVPLYGGGQVKTGSDCSMPQEQAAREQCDVFKTVGIQGVPSMQPAGDLAHAVTVTLSAIPIQEPLISASVFVGCGPPVFTQDLFALTSVLRL